MIDALAYPEGDATFVLPIDKKIVSFDAENGGVGDIQGVVDNATNQVTFTVPYTAGSGEYAAYTSDPITVTGENGDSNTLTISYPSGTFAATGDITVTVTVAGADTSFDVIKQTGGVTALFGTFDFKVNGTSKGNLTLTAVGGIIDREFGDGVHDFIYITGVSPAGRTWLTHNLGAPVTNLNSSDFDPTARISTDFDDLKYNGSHYQHGRYSDGHELITDWSLGYSQNGLTNYSPTRTNTATPNNNTFYFPTGSPYTWTTNNTTKWNGVNGLNNPCPIGFRVPTVAEAEDEIAASTAIAGAGATTSEIVQVLRDNPIQLLTNRSMVGGSYTSASGGGYWLEDEENSDFAHTLHITANALMVYSFAYATGHQVRCIKDTN